jgi:hypothetical protein
MNNPLDNSITYYNDFMSVKDILSKTPRSTLLTEITILDGNGHILFDKLHNMTAFGGRLSLLENAFGITPNTSQHLLLDTVMGINHSQTAAVLANNVRRNAVVFAIGNGAVNPSTPSKVYDPHNYETDLYNKVPFRCVAVGSDLSTADAAAYRLRKIITINNNNYVAYYGKLFSPGTVYTEFNGASFTPLASYTTPVDTGDNSHPLAGGSVLSYIQFTLTVTATEFKEWYLLTNNDSLTGASISEIGLVMGADLANSNDNNRTELAAAELFAKMTSSSVPLDSEGSSRTVIYRVYS